jgi:hypothetical protein
MIKKNKKNKKMLSKKNEKWAEKKTLKGNKRKELKIKLLTHKLLPFTLSYLMLASW